MATITREQAKFILSACATEAELREHLRYPCVCEARGKRWVCATDGHRLHAVVAPPDIALGYCVDKSGSIVSAPRDLKFPPVEQVWTDENDGHAVKIKLDRLKALTSTRHPKMLVKFGAGVEASDPRPHYEGDGAPDTCVCAWAKYIGDAILAVPGGKRAPTHVLVARGGRLDPIIVMEDAPAPTWRAIVMPVRV